MERKPDVAERVLGVSFHVSINPFGFLPMCAIRPRSRPTGREEELYCPYPGKRGGE
jgi:hypothetical protein